MKTSEYILVPLVFLVNIIGLCTSIYVGDSSLFSAASFSLGTAHPPGYPLFVVLGKLMTFLPFGNVGMKTNLVSAISGTLACLLVYKASMLLTEDVHSSWAAAIICGISPIFFAESLKAEAYTLNSFLCMIVFLLGLSILKGKSLFKSGMLGLFVIGLGMGNHHTMGFMGIIFLLPIALRWRELELRWLPLGIIAFLAGFSVNSLLYLRSVALVHSGGLIVYSYAGSWHDFVKVLLRQDYQGAHASTTQTVSRCFSLGVSWFYGLRNSLVFLAYPSTRPVLPFLVIGFYGLRKKKNILAYFIFAFIVWLLLLAKMVWSAKEPSAQDVEVVSVYFLPVVPILYCIVSVGFSSVLSWAGNLSRGLLHRVVPYALVLLPFALLPYSYAMTDALKAPIAYDYGRDMLSALPVNSLLMNYTDNAMFITFYMRAVERLREDVLAMDTGVRKDVYSLESSPPWKYRGLFPAFYRESKSTVKQINEEFALRGKFFANSPLNMTTVVKKSYEYYPYVFTVALWPEGVDDREFRNVIRSEFLSAYRKSNYERIAAQPVRYDFLGEELVAQYSINSMIYGDFLKRRGYEKEGDKYYALAFSMCPPKKYLWPFINFLVKDGQEKEAYALLGKLKTVGGEEGRFAELLERKAKMSAQKGSYSDD